MSDSHRLRYLVGVPGALRLVPWRQRNGNAVRLYARDAATVESINRHHRNETYLPGH